jgi:hypothetical protein
MRQAYVKRVVASVSIPIPVASGVATIQTAMSVVADAPRSAAICLPVKRCRLRRSTCSTIAILRQVEHVLRDFHVLDVVEVFISEPISWGSPTSCRPILSHRSRRDIFDLVLSNMTLFVFSD